VDLQAHGRTADIDRPMTFEGMADDVAAMIKHLGLERADVMRYSLGGGVAWQTAIRHPEVVRKLMLVSTPFKRDGWYPEVLAGMEQMDPEADEADPDVPTLFLHRTEARGLARVNHRSVPRHIRAWARVNRKILGRSVRFDLSTQRQSDS
jgi:pimeloyl-ACP methyl ester carboxylesterase